MGINVSRAIEYVDDNNGRRVIKRHVPQKYMMLFEDVTDIVKRHLWTDVPQDDAILLKEPGLYCFLLRCKMPGVEPFMEWAVETVLPRDVRELTSVIEEKVAAIALFNDDLKNREYENVCSQGEMRAKDQQIKDVM